MCRAAIYTHSCHTGVASSQPALACASSRYNLDTWLLAGLFSRLAARQGLHAYVSCCAFQCVSHQARMWGSPLPCFAKERDGNLAAPGQAGLNLDYILFSLARYTADTRCGACLLCCGCSRLCHQVPLRHRSSLSAAWQEKKKHVALTVLSVPGRRGCALSCCCAVGCWHPHRLDAAASWAARAGLPQPQYPTRVSLKVSCWCGPGVAGSSWATC